MLSCEQLDREVCVLPFPFLCPVVVVLSFVSPKGIRHGRRQDQLRNELPVLRWRDRQVRL